MNRKIAVPIWSLIVMCVINALVFGLIDEEFIRNQQRKVIKESMNEYYSECGYYDSLSKLPNITIEERAENVKQFNKVWAAFSFYYNQLIEKQ